MGSDSQTEVVLVQRMAECEDCEVHEQNASVIMLDVARGERNPEVWWCPEHRFEFNEETRQYRESKRRDDDRPPEVDDER